MLHVGAAQSFWTSCIWCVVQFWRYAWSFWRIWGEYCGSDIVDWRSYLCDWVVNWKSPWDYNYSVVVASCGLLLLSCHYWLRSYECYICMLWDASLYLLSFYLWFLTKFVNNVLLLNSSYQPHINLDFESSETLIHDKYGWHSVQKVHSELSTIIKWVWCLIMTIN